MISIQENTTVGQLVADHYRTADVLRRYGIDFCCGGKRTLAEACAQRGIEWNALRTELEQALEQNMPPAQNPNAWPPDFLADYIVQVHHRYLRDHLPILLEYTAKIARVHGERHPELKVVEKQVRQLAHELLSHLEKEERILFPYIAELCRSEEYQKPFFGSAQNPISIMEMEHDTAGEILENLHSLTNDFTPPQDACTTYRITFAKLRELDEDLRQHVHLENNILFPKALALERLRVEKTS